jgi:alpha-galactosidase
LGYVCFGCPEVQEWALLTLARLVTEYRCDWIKLDFNVDPGAGCNRTDHGHGAGDGLYAHYRGYYSMLSRFRSLHPDVTLENCSSGGLRIDLGIMRQTHLTFLSDPDWPEHNLQVFWGATLMLAPEICLHWGLSEWITPHPHQTFDPRDPSLTQQRLDFCIRSALLGAAGVSLRLPDLPRWVADRIAFHARFYQTCMRAFVREGVLFRLTDQPRRDGRGDRWCAFQYCLPQQHLLAVFRLRGAASRRTLPLHNLEPAASYRITTEDNDSEWRCRGSDLLGEGIDVDWLDEEDSAIIFLKEERSGE